MIHTLTSNPAVYEMSESPFLIKPDQDELSQIRGKAVETAQTECTPASVSRTYDCRTRGWDREIPRPSLFPPS